MKTYLILVTLFVVFCTTLTGTAAFAADRPAQTSPGSIVIDDNRYVVVVNDHCNWFCDSQNLQAEAINAFTKAGWTIVDRQLEPLFNEFDLSNAGLLQRKTAVQPGTLLGATHAIVITMVDQANAGSSVGTQYQSGNCSTSINEINGFRAVLVARIQELSSGKVVSATDVTETVTSVGYHTQVGKFQFGEEAKSQEVLAHKAVGKAIIKLAKELPRAGAPTPIPDLTLRGEIVGLSLDNPGTFVFVTKDIFKVGDKVVIYRLTGPEPAAIVATAIVSEQFAPDTFEARVETRYLESVVKNDKVQGAPQSRQDH